MIEELSEPLNPKLKDPVAFNNACDDVSQILIFVLQILVQLCTCRKWIP